MRDLLDEERGNVQPVSQQRLPERRILAQNAPLPRDDVAAPPTQLVQQSLVGDVTVDAELQSRLTVTVSARKP